MWRDHFQETLDRRLGVVPGGVAGVPGCDRRVTRQLQFVLLHGVEAAALAERVGEVKLLGLAGCRDQQRALGGIPAPR